MGPYSNILWPLRWGKMLKFIIFLLVMGIILLIWKLESISSPCKNPEMYSYKKVYLFSFNALIISLVASLIVYHFTKSFEVVIILFSIFVAYIIGGGIKSFYAEYRKKHRGAKKQD